MTQPAPSYPRYQPLPPPMMRAAPPKAAGGGLTSMLAGILALVAAGLAFGGSFAPITTFRNTFEGGDQTTVTASKISWWSLTDDGSSTPFETENLLFWLVLLLVAALLVLGAVFAFVASSTRSPGPTTGSRSLITAGVGVLLGVLLLESLQVLRESSTYDNRPLESGESLDYLVGLGLVLPLCGLGVGLVAVVLAHVGQRQRAFREEPNTPKMGFPAPYGYRPAPAGAPGAQMPVGAAPAKDLSAERATDAEWADKAADEDDNSSDTTVVVSGATVAAQDSSASAEETQTPAQAAPVTPPAPPAPPASVEAPAPASAPGAATAAAASASEENAATNGTSDAAAEKADAGKDDTEKGLGDLPAAPPAPELVKDGEKDEK
ncbi:hypothetical protein [Actinophytocola oryzae]|uniref:hypothetical protein n=1 Tax=Actinophytocola oryzae TaxID=502181 RepID=UPI0010629D56|nr:hypothetical protein [Actinophytocola oryzae]